MPGRTKLCYKKKSTKSNGSMQFISSRRNAHQKNRRTYSKFWMRMKREKSRNKSNYQHLQNVWNKTNTQLQQSQQENQELLAEQTLHEIERVSECDTDGDIDLYQAPYKLTEIDLIKIFELLQHCSYRALPRIIEICRMLSDDFVLPSNGWINKQKQVKQEMYNHAIIAYQTTMGTFKCDDLTMGTDGSGMDGHKFQTMNLTKPSGHEEKKFDHMVLGYKMLPRGDAEGIATVTKETFEEINAWRLHLNQEGFGGEHENDEIKRQSMDEDDVNVDGINNTSSPNESLLLCPSVKLQSQIQNMLMDGSTTEESAINKVFENVPLKSPRNIWKCLEHGKCDLFKGFMASLEDTRKENAHHIVSYEHGGISECGRQQNCAMSRAKQNGGGREAKPIHDLIDIGCKYIDLEHDIIAKSELPTNEDPKEDITIGMNTFYTINKLDVIRHHTMKLTVANPANTYCVCAGKHRGSSMIQCGDRCKIWYHRICVGLSEAQIREYGANNVHWICDKCKTAKKMEI
eukprot:253654_1